MPTYDYVCAACDHAFEHFQSMTSRRLRKCPACGQPKLERLVGSGAGVIFKGSGFYETDYKRSGSAAPKEGTSSDAKEGGAAKESDTSSDKPSGRSSSKDVGKDRSKDGSKDRGKDSPKDAAKGGEGSSSGGAKD